MPISDSGLFGLLEGKQHKGANLDPVTGLYNKPYALALAQKAVEKHTHDKVSLIMIDIDDFKSINDGFGHIFGDQVILKMADIIRESVGDRGFSSRFGGDEFFICLYDVADEEELRAFLRTIIYGYAKAFPGVNHTFSCSVGVAEYPRNSSNFNQLFQKADCALYLAKFKGKNRYIIYKEEMHGEIPENGEYNQLLIARDARRRETQTKALRSSLSELVAIGCRNPKVDALIKPVCNDIIDAYKLQGISIFLAPDYSCKYRFGTYSNPPESAAHVKDPDVLELFNKYNFFSGSTKHHNSATYDCFHTVMLNHNITHTMQCLIGYRNKPKAVITFDCETDTGDYSAEEERDLMLVADLIAEVLFK